MQEDARVREVSDVDIDRMVNRAFGAFTACFGRPFIQAETRNLRAVVRDWCPLIHASTYSLVDRYEFAAAYVKAHFFDRFFYTAEVANDSALNSEATARFLQTVREGEEANERIRMRSCDSHMNSVLCEASLIAGRILGELDYPEIFNACKHGPGASTTVRVRDSYLDIKAVDISGTRSMLETFTRHYLQWDVSLRDWLVKGLRHCRRNLGFRVIEHLKMSFVPNKFDKKRGICPETTLGMFFQLGTGKIIAQLLAQFANIDIETQADCHRLLVVKASLLKELGLATIDWSEASDRVWLEICRAVLPSDWYEWLIHIRTGAVLVGDHVVELPMISTMGNGYTFPLETLVFYVLLCGLARTHGVAELGISVFGDDCVVPVALMPHVHTLAVELGWKLNLAKSFEDGGFRESCGVDAYRGLRIRTFKIKRPVDTTTNTLKAWSYTVFNGMVESAESVMGPGAKTQAPLWEWLKEVHDELELGEIFVVPPRFSDTSGARLRLTDYDPYHSQMWDWSYMKDLGGLFPSGIRVPFYGRGGRKDPSMMWRFLRLSNKPSRRKPVWGEYPYLLLRLRGLVPDLEAAVDYRPEGRVDPAENEPGGLDALGSEPRKREVNYQQVGSSVHTWTYFL